MKICPNCGKSISEFALSCPFCGNILSGQEHDSPSADSKTVAGTTPAKKYTAIGITTLISIVMLFLCQLVFAGCYSIFGANIQSMIIAAGLPVSIRSILVLLVSGVLFGVISNIEKLNTTGKMVILTLVCAAIHFGTLWSVHINPNDVVVAWEYSPIIIHVYAVVLGVGVSILQGSLCITAHNSKRKSVVLNIGLVTVVFFVFSVLGIFLGTGKLHVGIAGGFAGICGALAAVAVAVLISIRHISQN